MRTPVSFTRHLAQPFRAPGLGEHSDHIAQSVAGLPAETVAALRAAGVFE